MNISLGFIALFLVVCTLYVAADIFIPFVIALCFWYLINILARLFSRIKIASVSLPKIWCFALSIGVAVLVLLSIVKLISSNVRLVADAAPAYQENFEIILPKLMKPLGLEKEKTIVELTNYVDLKATLAFLAKNLTGLAGKSAVIFFYTIFLLYEQRFFKQKLQKIFHSPEALSRVERILGNIDSKMQRYLKVKVVISTLTGSLTYMVLYYYDVDFSQFWGLLAFVLNFIPYVGSIFAVTLPALISLAQYGDVSFFLFILMCLTLIQVVLGNIIDPRLLGDSLNLSPIMIIVSLAAWGSIWGVAGMFLAVPILSIIVLSLAQFPSTLPIAVFLSRTGDVRPS